MAPPPETHDTLFVQLVSHILKSTKVTFGVVVIALRYYDMYTRLAEEFVDATELPKLAGQVKIVVASMMTAAKFLDDVTYGNRSWSVVSGIDLAELTEAEIALLRVLSYNLHFYPNDFRLWMARLHVVTDELERARFAKFEQARQPRAASDSPAQRPASIAASAAMELTPPECAPEPLTLEPDGKFLPSVVAAVGAGASSGHVPPLPAAAPIAVPVTPAAEAGPVAVSADAIPAASFGKPAITRPRFSSGSSGKDAQVPHAAATLPRLPPTSHPASSAAAGSTAVAATRASPAKGVAQLGSASSRSVSTESLRSSDCDMTTDSRRSSVASPANPPGAPVLAAQDLGKVPSVRKPRQPSGERRGSMPLESTLGLAAAAAASANANASASVSATDSGSSSRSSPTFTEFTTFLRRSIRSFIMPFFGGPSPDATPPEGSPEMQLPVRLPVGGTDGMWVK